MPHSYIAYIDESGDDGLSGRYRHPGMPGGSSRWLSLSASVWRYSVDADAVKWRDEIRQQFGAQAQRRPIHFKDLGHNQRVLAAQVLAQKPIRSICVMANKPSIPADIYSEKNQLYFNLTRYVLERVSWLCRDLRDRVPEGDGRVKIVFSRRGGLSYPLLREYLCRSKDAQNGGARIRWSVIDIDGIEAMDHSTRAGLQIADIIAACMTAGLEPDIYGNCERRYAEILKPRIYCRNGNYLGYGVKLVPRANRIEFNEQQKAFVELFASKEK